MQAYISYVVLFAALYASPPVAAQSPGELLWSVDLGFSRVFDGAEPTVGPDGTVYVHSDDLFAISPAGELLWSAPLLGSGVVGLGSDGRVYASSSNQIQAFTAAGEHLWTFTEEPHGVGFLAGPSVGPDGNIYVISLCSEFCDPDEGLGAFSLTPDGSLRWSVLGFEDFNPAGFVNRKVPFGPNRLYGSFDTVPGCQLNTGIVALDFAGNIPWCAQTQDYSAPVTSPSGNVHMGEFGALTTWNSDDGNVIWSISPWVQPGNLSTGPDGAVYGYEGFGLLRALDADGTERWSVDPVHSGDFPFEATVAPDNRTLIVASIFAFGQNGELIGLDPATGSEQWTMTLTGQSETPVAAAAFSPDGRVAYVTVSSTSTTRLLAIQARGPVDGMRISAPNPGIAGEINCFNVTGATPEAAVHLLLGLASGVTVPPGCTTPIGIADARHRDTEMADGSGAATLCTRIPAPASGRTLLTQALDRDVSGCQVSNVDETTYR